MFSGYAGSIPFVRLCVAVCCSVLQCVTVCHITTHGRRGRRALSSALQRETEKEGKRGRLREGKEANVRVRARAHKNARNG